MKNELILGINDGYASCATVLQDGSIRFNVLEERFNKIKNFGGVPVNALKWMDEREGVDFSNVQTIGIAWKAKPFRSIRDFTKARHKYFNLLIRFLPTGWIANDVIIQQAVKVSEKSRNELSELIEFFSPYGLTCENFCIYNHHHCHAAATLYGSGFLNKYPEVLVITLDGSGDGESMTVWKANSQGMFKLASQNSYHSIGILIARLTQYMGMKPLEHEYKLMGMAPYVSGGDMAEKAYEIFKPYFGLDPSGLKIINHMETWGKGMIRKLHKDLFQIRFDAICYAIQRLLEELVVTLVLNWIKHTGIHRVVVGGGVFMNVKLNMILAQHDDLEDFFVMPSCGDDSLSLGAAYLAQEKVHPGSSQPVDTLYSGYQISETEIKDAIRKDHEQLDYKKSPDIERAIAELLANDEIVARCAGRAEWGARALGNRSILCNPTKAQNIHRINKAVKKRDFWMPFTPSILDTYADKYLINPKKRKAPYMILAFHTHEQAKQDIICGLHPFDYTARPQVVTEAHNPRYYKLLKHFETLTGIGGIVNTSFNLHGFPIVNSADDAIHVLLHSGLDYVAIEEYLFWKKHREAL